MLICRYTDPPQTDEDRNQEEKQKKAGKSSTRLTNFDITGYILSYTWSGDVGQAARKLEFSIAYNNPEKDASFVCLNLKLGGLIKLAEKDEDSPKETQIFLGRIFVRKRSTESYTFEFTAYDDMIYLAKSHISGLYEHTVTDGIRKVCAYMGIPISDKIPNIQTKVSFFADDKSCTEIFKMLFDKAKADPVVAKEYHAICINGSITVVPKGEMIDGEYIASDKNNVFGSEHSESIEEMVNRVVMVDDHGNECQVFTNTDDQTHFGTLAMVYKAQPPKKKESVDNVASAKAMLKRTKNESSLSGIGNIQSIAGYSITVKEEQLKGKFFITADSHTFEGNKHTMRLTLEYIPDKEELPKIKQTINREPDFSKSKEMAG